ncbi:MAG: hypothetical protein R3C27_01665 [Hyphomonadaceae bacterium]
MSEALSRRTLLALAAAMPLSACSQVMFLTRFTVESASCQAYEAALHGFLQHYRYRDTEWRPGFGSMNFEGVWESLRTHFWISRDQNVLEALAMYKTQLFSMIAPGVDVLAIGDDFSRRISSVEGVHFEQGFY